MKTYFTLLALLCLQLTVSAQELTYENFDPDYPDAKSMEYVLQNYDPSGIPTGLLYDLSVNWVNPLAYPGTDSPDLLPMNTQFFGMHYASMYGAALRQSALIDHPRWYTDQVNAWRPGDAVPILATVFDFNYIDSTALDNNLITLANDRLEVAPGAGSAPYLEARTVAVAPAIDGPYDTSQPFIFTDNSFRGNGTLGVTQFAYYNGTTYTPIPLGIPFTFPAGSRSDNLTKVRLQMTDGTYQYASFANGVKPISQVVQSRYSASQNDSIVTEGIIATIFTACENSGDNLPLRKPLIWVEGYNPSSPLIGGNKKFGSIISGKLSDNLAAPGVRLIDTLQSANFDIVYIDYQGEFGKEGVKDIFEIADDLIEIIEEVNHRKNLAGSFEDNVIVGTSMGGLVSKIALRRMELDGKNHDTRTLLAFDSPHKGVNLSPAYQYAIKYLDRVDASPLAGVILNEIDTSFNDVGANLGDFVPALRITSELLDEPATEQLCMYHYEHGETVNDAFYAQVDVMGELDSCEMVVISNGSAIGETQHDIVPGELSFRINTSNLVAATGTGVLIYQLISAQAAATPIPSVIISSAILGGIIAGVMSFGILSATNTQTRIKLKGWTLVGNQSDEKVFAGRINIQLLGEVVIRRGGLKAEVDHAPPLDDAPGSYFYVDFLPTAVLDQIPDLALKVNPAGFCFNPTISGMDMATDDLYAPALASELTPPAYYPPSLDPTLAVPRVASTNDNYIPKQGTSANPNNIGYHNQDHVVFTAQNIPFFISYILHPTNINTAAIGSLPSTYNFGNTVKVNADGSVFLDGNGNPVYARTSDRINSNLSIASGRNVYVNRSEPIGFVNDPNGIPGYSGTHFELLLENFSCDEDSSLLVRVETGGEMLVGEWGGSGASLHRSTGHVVLQKKTMLDVYGELHLSDSSMVTVMRGAKLLIRREARLQLGQNSRILVEPGGVLAFEDQSLVRLWSGEHPDGTARIDVHGTLEINGTPELQDGSPLPHPS